jgi:hypothetical protein
MLLEIAAECEAEAERAAAEMIAQKRRMQLLRQRAAMLREMSGSGSEPTGPANAP